jgi:outer membrane immunogenic protein
MSRNTIRLGFASALALTISSPLFAADMPVKTPIAAPVAVSSWDGWYVGGELGWRGTKSDWNTNCVQGGGLAVCGNAFNGLLFPGAPDGTANQSFTTSGLRSAIYGGFMWQVPSNIVLGMEWDYGFAHKSSTIAGIAGCSTAACTGGALVPFNLSGDSTTMQLGNDYSMRGRAGYLFLPNLLAYGTGGIAFQRVSSIETCNGTTSPACSIGVLNSTNNTQTLVGWTAGGGLEWKVYSNWLLRGEYRYSDYGNYKPAFFVGSGVVETYNTVHVKTQIAQVGLSYLFPIGH